MGQPSSFQTFSTNCDALRDLLPFVQFEKRENSMEECYSVTFSKVAGLKVTLLHACFSCFLNCRNSPKSRNPTNIVPSHRHQSIDLLCE